MLVMQPPFKISSYCRCCTEGNPAHLFEQSYTFNLHVYTMAHAQRVCAAVRTAWLARESVEKNPHKWVGMQIHTGKPLYHCTAHLFIQH